MKLWDELLNQNHENEKNYFIKNNGAGKVNKSYRRKNIYLVNPVILNCEDSMRFEIFEFNIKINRHRSTE